MPAEDEFGDNEVSAGLVIGVGISLAFDAGVYAK